MQHQEETKTPLKPKEKSLERADSNLNQAKNSSWDKVMMGTDTQEIGSFQLLRTHSEKLSHP